MLIYLIHIGIYILVKNIVMLIYYIVFVCNQWRGKGTYYFGAIFKIFGGWVISLATAPKYHRNILRIYKYVSQVCNLQHKGNSWE